MWDYLVHLRRCGAAATKAMSFVQTLRFCQHVLQVDGADLCVASRRLVGQSELQAALKGPTKQARPLTVMEVRKLQKFMADPSKELQERLICSHLVLMIYTRSRNSDLAYVEGISHDNAVREGRDEFSGFIQFTTRYHKSASRPSPCSCPSLLVVSQSGLNHGWTCGCPCGRKLACRHQVASKVLSCRLQI